MSAPTVLRFPDSKCDALCRGLLDPKEVSALGFDNVRAILHEPGRTRYVNLDQAALVEESRREFVAHGDGESRVMRYAMITETALPPFDFVVKVDGGQLEDFRKRGSPLMFGHGFHGLGDIAPLGTIGNIQRVNRRGRRAMLGDADFTAAGIEEDGEFVKFAQEIWRLVEHGIIRGFSIGLDELESREPTKAEVKKFGIKDRLGFIISKWKLVEGSVTPLGRDPNAQQIRRIRNEMSLSVKRGRLSEEFAKECLGVLTGACVHERSYHLMCSNSKTFGQGVEPGSEPPLVDPQPTPLEWSDDLEENLTGMRTAIGLLDERMQRVEEEVEGVAAISELEGRVRVLTRELRVYRDQLSYLRGYLSEQARAAGTRSPALPNDESKALDVEGLSADEYSALATRLWDGEAVLTEAGAA